jgi:8-oxo-dGTP pyrophosphatase MutT (NUDIX family)
VSERDSLDGYDADSVAALLVTPKGEFILQRREDRPGIDFPNYRGLFGGAIDPGETAECALLRELREELDFSPPRIARFAVLEFDERASGGLNCRRSFFEVVVEADSVSTMCVHEGAGMDVLDRAGVLTLPAVIPYDLCAILMYDRKMKEKHP